MTKNAQGFMMPDASSEFIEFSLNREDKDGLIRIFSDDFEHLYIAEFQGHHNAGQDTMHGLSVIAHGMVGKRLTFKALTA